jgi:hypothetical protein
MQHWHGVVPAFVYEKIRGPHHIACAANLHPHILRYIFLTSNR